MTGYLADCQNTPSRDSKALPERCGGAIQVSFILGSCEGHHSCRMEFQFWACTRHQMQTLQVTRDLRANWQGESLCTRDLQAC